LPISVIILHGALSEVQWAKRVGQGVMPNVLHFAETQYVALTFPT